MRKKLLILTALAAIFIISVSTKTNAQTKTPANDSALLYEITGKNLKKPSYLFGTIHLICEKDLFPAEKFNAYVGKTEQLILEFDLDDQTAIQKAVRLSVLADGKSIKDLVTAEEYAEIDAVYKKYLGVSFDLLANYKPLISQTYLLTSPQILGCQPPVVYDNLLAQNAVAAKMPVIGLETAEEQIAVIDSQTIADQIKALKKTAANPDKSINEFKTLYQKYLAQNSDEIYKYIAGQFKAENYSQEKMLDIRNAKWIPVIEKNIAEKPSFIAVGGGHLGGEKGVVNLLRAKGYKLKPIKF